MAKPTVGIRLDEDTQKRLKLLGYRRDRTPHYLMKEAVEAYLDREEEIETERALLKDRWQKYELTGESVRHNDVKRWAKSLSNSKSAE